MDLLNAPRVNAVRSRVCQRGSYTIEGMVAIGVFFLLMLLIVQLGFLVLARNVAATSLDAALRRAVAADLGEGTVKRGLERDVLAVVPGASNVRVGVVVEGDIVRAEVRFRWLPPGPDLVPVNVQIERSIVRTVPP